MAASPFLFRPARLRFPAQHPFFEDGDVHRHLYLQDLLEEEEDPERRKARHDGPGFSCQAAGCQRAFDSLESYEHHYQALHRHVCASCQRPFPSAHLLDLHLLEWHDSLFQVMAEKSCMYRCLVESCPGRFKGAKERKEHVVNIHQYPPDFRFNRPLACKSSAKGKNPPSSIPMELNVEEPRVQVSADAMDVDSRESTAESALNPRIKSALSCYPEHPEKPSYRSRIVVTFKAHSQMLVPGVSRGKELEHPDIQQDRGDNVLGC